MKRLLLMGAIIVAPWNVFAQPVNPPNPAPPGVVDTRCEAVPANIPTAELAKYMCNPYTGEWVHRETGDITPIAVLAQADLAPAAAPATATETPTEEPPPEVGELVSGAGKVIDDWKNIGWLAGVIALINLLLNLVRFTPIETWLASLDYKWIKPLIATILGAALGGFSTFSTGAGILNSIVAGALAGLTSVGFHELVDKTRKRTTKLTEA